MQFITDEQLGALGLSSNEVADAIEHVLLQKVHGKVWTGPKITALPGDGRYMMATLAAADDPGLIVVKAVALNPENPKNGFDSINGAIMILDSETGMLRCVMGANWITAVRTAGLSAVAARKLANPRSRVLGFVGCGVQARSHLDTFADMFPIDTVQVFGRGKKNTKFMVDSAHAKGLHAIVADTPPEAMDAADIVVTSITATFDGDPFLDPAWLKPGAHATITDLCKPWIRGRMQSFESIVLDDLEEEKKMSASMVPPVMVTCDIAQLVSGQHVAKYDPNRRSAFISRGMSIGDFAVAARAYALITGE